VIEMMSKIKHSLEPGIYLVPKDRVKMQPPLYNIGDVVYILKKTVEQGVTTTTEIVGCIGCISVSYWEGDYYEHGYKYEYYVYLDVRMSALYGWVQEKDIKREGYDTV
jgi:hypothetical protein